MEPPKIHIDPQRIMAEDFEKVLISKYDIFYRRIVEYVLNILEKKNETDILAILVDDEGREYEMTLPKEGFQKSLVKAKEYFTMIEEYETCDLIKQIQKQIA
tara:strand:+ start:2333 stop:2638 length:306 start_codon:yes stop_codon:yes gene_type:complete